MPLISRHVTWTVDTCWTWTWTEHLTCWQVSDMGGEALHTGNLMCLLAQALGLTSLEYYLTLKVRLNLELKETLARAALRRISMTWMWSLLTTKSLTQDWDKPLQICFLRNFKTCRDLPPCGAAQWWGEVCRFSSRSTGSWLSSPRKAISISLRCCPRMEPGNGRRQIRKRRRFLVWSIGGEVIKEMRWKRMT